MRCAGRNRKGDAVAAIADGEELAGETGKRAHGLSFPRKLHRKKEEGTVISPQHLARTKTA